MTCERSDYLQGWQMALAYDITRKHYKSAVPHGSYVVLKEICLSHCALKWMHTPYF